MPKSKRQSARVDATSSTRKKSVAAKRTGKKNKVAAGRLTGKSKETASLNKALKTFKSEVRARIASGKSVSDGSVSTMGGKSEAFAAREVQVRIAELEAKAAAAAKAGKRSKRVETRLEGDLARLKSKSRR